MIQNALDEWILNEAISFSLDPSSLNGAIDRVVSSLDPSVELLGFGEAFHGGEEVLIVAEPAKPHRPRGRQASRGLRRNVYAGSEEKDTKNFSSASPEGSRTSAILRQFVSIIRYQALRSPYPTTSEYLI